MILRADDWSWPQFHRSVLSIFWSLVQHGWDPFSRTYSMAMSRVLMILTYVWHCFPHWWPSSMTTAWSGSTGHPIKWQACKFQEDETGLRQLHDSPNGLMKIEPDFFVNTFVWKSGSKVDNTCPRHDSTKFCVYVPATVTWLWTTWHTVSTQFNKGVGNYDFAAQGLTDFLFWYIVTRFDVFS